MNNIFTIMGTIAINSHDAFKAIDNTIKKAESANKSMSQAFEKIGSAAMKCGKVIASGMAVGTAAVGALVKASIGEFADYEQLVGGVETLFKDSKNKVIEYANEAYKTAGLSANDYMETVTSFSASLLQGLGGDTEAAAEMANMAITDMSDNANKMGTDMGMIQNAYQGFAKQNYTMLDNLKLGYGGTQEEMARLVNESGVLGSAIKVTAETVKDVPFHKIIEAIHVVQTEMGITGTTAKEASETISGSFSAMKSSWKNLLTGLATEEQNLDKLLSNFLTSGETLAQNVVRVLPRIRRNVAGVLENLTQYVGAKIRSCWNNTIWPFIQKQMKLRFGVEFPDWQSVKTKLESEWNRNVQPVLDGFQTSVGKVFDWFTQNGESVKSVFESIAIVFAGTWAVAHPLKTAIGLLGAAFVLLNTDTTNASDTLKSIKSFLEDITAWISENKTGFTAFFGSLGIVLLALKAKLVLLIGIVAIVAANWDNLKKVIGLAVDAINTFFNTTLPEWWADDVVKPIVDWWNSVTTAIDNATIALEKFFGINSGSGVEVSDSGTSHGGVSGKPFANGLYRVPYDGFPAILHKDEAVLNRLDASEWRTAQAYSNNATMQEIRRELHNVSSLLKGIMTNTGRGQSLTLDTGVLVGQIAPRIDTALGTIAVRRGRG